MEVALYTVTHRASGKRYVGITQDPAKRWNDHKSDARRGSEHHFHRAIRLHGENSFVFEVQTWFPTPEMAKLAEQTSICFSQPEYNSTAGGDGTFGHKHTDEAKQKMSVAKKGKPSPLKGVAKPDGMGPKLSEIQRNSTETVARLQQLAEAQRGVPLSAEHRAAVSAGLMGRKHSPETRAKMSAAAKARYARQRAGN
jgi:group I intron endonuclease